LAAARGDGNAMFALAMFALNGRAGARDREASTRWLAAAAKLGHPLAAYDLALLYIEGQMFAQDFNRAAELLRIAAQGGSADAQYALGTFYKPGRGVPQDARQAAQWWAKAALADNTDAQVDMLSRYITATASSATRRPQPHCSAKPRCAAARSPRTAWRGFLPAAAARRATSAKRPNGI